MNKKNSNNNNIVFENPFNDFSNTNNNKIFDPNFGNNFGIESFPFGPIPPLVDNFAPNFKAEAVLPDSFEGEFFELQKYIKGSYCLLIFYPANFTYLCPSELVSINNRISKFEKLNTKVVAVSADSIFSHITWKALLKEKSGIERINFPLVSDVTKSISQSYRALGNRGLPLRATYIINDQGVIVHESINCDAFGRNSDEMLRLIEAAQHYDKTGEKCQYGWKSGEKALANNINSFEYIAQNHEKL